MKARLSLASLVIFALSGAALSAQEQVVNYTFDNGGAPAAWSRTLLKTEPKAPAFTSAGGGGQGGLSSQKGNFYARVQSLGDTPASSGKVTFVLSPAKPLKLAAITFDVGYQNSGNGPHPAYTLNYWVGVKIGNASETLLPETAAHGVPSSSDPAYKSGSPEVNTPARFDLSALKEVSSDAVFTIHVYATEVGGSLTPHQTARIDNITVSAAAP